MWAGREPAGPGLGAPPRAGAAPRAGKLGRSDGRGRPCAEVAGVGGAQAGRRRAARRVPRHARARGRRQRVQPTRSVPAGRHPPSSRSEQAGPATPRRHGHPNVVSFMSRHAHPQGAGRGRPGTGGPARRGLGAGVGAAAWPADGPPARWPGRRPARTGSRCRHPGALGTARVSRTSMVTAAASASTAAAIHGNRTPRVSGPGRRRCRCRVGGPARVGVPIGSSAAAGRAARHRIATTTTAAAARTTPAAAGQGEQPGREQDLVQHHVGGRQLGDQRVADGARVCTVVIGCHQGPSQSLGQGPAPSPSGGASPGGGRG